nr:phasin family protein [Bradyrhizobium brasilense]
MKATSVEIAEALRETYASNAQSTTEFGLKLIELSQANTATAIDFTADLLASRSPVDALSLSATQARKVFETASAQNKELWELTQRPATETRESIKRQVDKALKQPS